jgi:hypothetical protein
MPRGFGGGAVSPVWETVLSMSRMLDTCLHLLKHIWYRMLRYHVVIISCTIIFCRNRINNTLTLFVLFTVTSFLNLQAIFVGTAATRHVLITIHFHRFQVGQLFALRGEVSP